MCNVNLFSEKKITLNLPQAQVEYYPQFYGKSLGHNYFDTLMQQTDWREDTITVFGKTYLQPRKTALYGEANRSYSYSGITMVPHPFTPLLLEIKEAVEATANTRFTTVLLNLYRDGNDSNGWHSDDERELGDDPVIASLSLGGDRMFYLKHKKDAAFTQRILLQHGSLLVMGPGTQINYKHQLPKTNKTVAPRINLTFRKLIREN
jgi:alkylated DNA repair dioxygenase AlkB